MAIGIHVTYVMMLQKANWTISYMLKPYLVKLVETDTLEKPIDYLLLSLLSLIMWQEDKYKDKYRLSCKSYK